MKNQRLRTSLVLTFAFSFFFSSFCMNSVASGQFEVRYEKYINATLEGLDLLRTEGALVSDRINFLLINDSAEVLNVNQSTSITNIALDILIQLDLLRNPLLHDRTLSKLEAIVDSLTQFEYHQDSGLFFGWYETRSPFNVVRKNLSSIDNFHLALALWTTSETLKYTRIGETAGALFDRMDLSMFVDTTLNLVGGNFEYRHGEWVRDAYNFSFFGSEARSLYSAGWALGLFKQFNQMDEFFIAAFNNLEVEFLHTPWGPILKSWDGGAFQLLLPELLLKESSYSQKLATSFRGYSHFIIAEGNSQGLPLPAGHSACASAGDSNEISFPKYIDKSGNPPLVANRNQDIHNSYYRNTWDTVVTPHALFMAATQNPIVYQDIFSQNEVGLFFENVGWMDGLHVRGEYTGFVVPSQLALNQEFILLSLLQITSQDRHSSASRALKNNAEVSARLQNFYSHFDEKFQEIQ